MWNLFGFAFRRILFVTFSINGNINKETTKIIIWPIIASVV